jgi:TRAP transporter TAXI family solute receptor
LIPVYTPPAGGVTYVLGAGVAAVSNKYLPEANFVHEATTGTMDMVRKLRQKEAQKRPAFALFATPDAPRAFKGEGEYGGKPFTALRTVAFVNSSDIYFVVPASSPIKSYADVKGKRIGVGSAGSTISNSAFFFFEQYGIKRTDFKPALYNYKEVVEGIQNGSLDGGFIGGSYPMPAYTELSLQHDVRIVPVDEKILQKVCSEHPHYYRTVIKAKSYKGLENDTTIYGFTGTMWTHAGVSTDMVYNVLKNLYEHRNDLYSIHRQVQKDFVLENLAKSTSVPFHPGAEKYLKEIGALKK